MFVLFFFAGDSVVVSQSTSECEDQQAQTDYEAYCRDQFKNLGVRPSEFGNDLFATAQFAKGASVGFYFGEVCTQLHDCLYCVQFLESKLVHSCIDCWFCVLEGDDDFRWLYLLLIVSLPAQVLCGQKFGSNMRYANCAHGESANAMLRQVILEHVRFLAS